MDHSFENDRNDYYNVSGKYNGEFTCNKKYVNHRNRIKLLPAKIAKWNLNLHPDHPITTFQMPATNVAVTAQLKIKDALVPENRFTLSDEEGFILREIPHGDFTLRVAGEGVCLLATYDVNGKMLYAQMLETMGGLITVQLSNENDTIERIALFWVESMENPRPGERVLELTAK